VVDCTFDCLGALTHCNMLFRPQSHHFGNEYCIEIIDGSSDATLGFSVVTAQTILQEQRDYLIHELKVPLIALCFAPVKFTQKRKVRLDLRSPDKDRGSLSFFNNPNGKSSGKSNSGKKMT
jgi:hypothetical protein